MASLEEKTASSIPIIDFLTWTTPFNASPEDRLETARELVEACHTYGFVYIKNHGISPELVAEAFETSKKFFDLPTDKKKLAANACVGTFRGYTWPGLVKAGAIGDDGIKKVGSEENIVDLNVSGLKGGILVLEWFLISSRRAMT